VNKGFVNLAGARVHYLSAGEHGSPVVLLHGGGVDSAALSWKRALPALAASHRVFAPEMPGYGESDRPAHFTHTLDTYVALLLQFMDALEIDKAHLAGVSMGGAISIGFTLAHPHHVVKLAPVSSYGLQRSVSSNAMSQALSYYVTRNTMMSDMTYAVLKRSRSLAGASLKAIFADPQHITPDLIDDVFAEIRKAGTGDAFAQFQKHEVTRAGVRTNFMDRLHEISALTCFIHGEKDSLVPLADAQEAAQHVPHARLEVMHNCGHWPQRERPDEFNRILSEFFHD
jgi:pimeloyl-ACP methyl ester carboxylesterase